MAETLRVEEFVAYGADVPIVDVRTPSEYQRGHIPGAANLPLFSDDERAEIGTLYRHDGRDAAMLQGLDIVGPRMRRLVEQARLMAPSDEVLLHCWRGGMRSEAVSWLLSFFGFRAHCLKGGYKAYRTHVLSLLNEPRSIIVLKGLTGSGKTEILAELAMMGEQTVDLERLASHKGSVFGHLGLPSQPSQEQFENNLASEWASVVQVRPVWLEDESRRLGRLLLPPAIYQAKSAAPAVLVSRPFDDRVARLVGEYGHYSTERLSEAIRSIARKLGGQRTKCALESVEDGRLAEACRTLLEYYDRAYLHALERVGRPYIQVDLPPSCPAREAASMVLECTAQLTS